MRRSPTSANRRALRQHRRLVRSALRDGALEGVAAARASLPPSARDAALVMEREAVLRHVIEGPSGPDDASVSRLGALLDVLGHGDEALLHDDTWAALTSARLREGWLPHAPRQRPEVRLARGERLVLAEPGTWLLPADAGGPPTLPVTLTLTTHHLALIDRRDPEPGGVARGEALWLGDVHEVAAETDASGPLFRAAVATKSAEYLVRTPLAPVVAQVVRLVRLEALRRGAGRPKVTAADQPGGARPPDAPRRDREPGPTFRGIPGSSTVGRPVDPDGLWRVLGCAATATPEEVKQAFRRGAARVHPDRNLAMAADHAEEEFKRLAHAFQILSDPARRAAYARGQRFPFG